AKDPGGNVSLPASLTPAVSITTLALGTDPDPHSTLPALYVGGTINNDNIAITPAMMTKPDGTVIYGVKVGMNMVSYGSFFSIGHVVDGEEAAVADHVHAHFDAVDDGAVGLGHHGGRDGDVVVVYSAAHVQRRERRVRIWIGPQGEGRNRHSRSQRSRQADIATGILC